MWDPVEAAVKSFRYTTNPMPVRPFTMGSLGTPGGWGQAGVTTIISIRADWQMEGIVNDPVRDVKTV